MNLQIDLQNKTIEKLVGIPIREGETIIVPIWFWRWLKHIPFVVTKNNKKIYYKPIGKLNKKRKKKRRIS